MRTSICHMAIAATCLAGALAGCGGGSSTSEPEAAGPVDRVVATIEVSPAAVSLKPGATVTVSAVAKDAQGNVVDNQIFTWRTSDSAIATVAEGVVTGVAPGTVTISASIGSVSSNRVALSVASAVVPPTASSGNLIDAAQAAGSIDSETALIYKVFASYGDARLPAQYKGDDDGVMESSVAEDLNNRFDTLTEATQRLLGPFTLRPSNVGSWLNPGPAGANAGSRATALARNRGQAVFRPSCQGDEPLWTSIAPVTAKVRVWYDTRRARDKIQAEFVANHMETKVWPMLITTLSFKEPLEDSFWGLCDGGDGRLDIYIVSGIAERGRTVPSTNAIWQSAVYVEIRSGDAPVVLEQTIPHEFMHAIQWSHRMAESQSSYGWFRDALANWAVEAVNPGNAALMEHSTCYLATPELSLESRAAGHCTEGNRQVNRDYGAYLFFQFIGRTKGNATVKAMLEATTSATTGVGAIEAVVGGIENVWHDFARTLWNQAPITQSFKDWDGNQRKPELPPDRPGMIAADLNGISEDETPLEEKINNLSAKHYHFTFSAADQTTRSLMFHNTFYANYKIGLKVSVRALLKPEDPNQPWREEDWTEYEWIGLCRDFKQQRIAEMVVIVSNAEWRGARQDVTAPEKPNLLRNNIGCYGYEGTMTRTFAHKSWSSGKTTVTFDAKFHYLPGTTPLQYSNLAEGRKRVPIAAPILAGGTLAFDESFVSNGCRYTANGSFAESPGANGMAVGLLTINYFNESLPTQMRVAQETLVGTAKRAYVGAGASKRIDIKGAITGPQPNCGTEYETAAGKWLLTHDESSPKPTVAANGHLLASFTASRPSDSHIEEYTWDLQPMREP